MIDPRFDTRPMFVISKDRERERAARDFLENLPSLKVTISSLGKWWKSLNYSDEIILGKVPESSLPSTVIHLDDKNLMQALDRVAGGTQSEHYLDRVAAIIVGRSVASAISKKPSLKTFDKAEVFLQIEFASWSEFLATFVSDIKATGEACRSRWIALLTLKNVRLEDFTGYREYSVEWLKEQTETFQKLDKVDLFDLWDGVRYPFRIPPQLRKRLLALSVLDTDAFIESVEMLPLPGIIESAMQELGVARQADQILSLIKGASPIFDPNGKWSGHSIAGFLPELVFEFADGIKRALEAVERQELFRSQTQPKGSNSPIGPRVSKASASEAFCAEEMQEWFSTAFGAIHDRKDGAYLLRHFCTYLIYLQRNKTDFGNEQDAIQVAINSIANILSASSPRWTKHDLLDKADEFSGRTGVDRKYYVLLTSALLDEEDVDEKWAAYLDLLRCRDKYLLMQVNRTGVLSVWQLHVLGRILACSPDPVTQFNEAWTCLYDERYFSRFQISHDSLNASVHIAAVAWGAILWLISENGPKGLCYKTAEELWKTVFDKLSVLHLMRRHVTSFSAARELSLLYASIKPIFKDKWKSTVLSTSGFLKSDPWLAATLLMNLFKNGVTPAELDEVLNETYGGLNGLRESLIGLQQFGFGDENKLFPEEDILTTLQMKLV